MFGKRAYVEVYDFEVARWWPICVDSGRFIDALACQQWAEYTVGVPARVRSQ